ncbi:alpha/beta hydrolase [Salinimicrobium sp. GXAS 041]|uniref:alpha/beta hydrolase n=1 Tax=Salinimicrobium sp. GXAS 041 TaxID=3400806 RepID=UPI003C71B7A0
MTNEKSLSYQTTNTYSTLNDFTPQTKNVWIVFHGIGYLSRYFLRHFKHLDPEENYIIAPQAPSKYYLNNKYKHVGASWLTKENTEVEMENILHYLDEIYHKEDLKNAKNLIVLGYSQGVSVATRWVARRKIQPAQLIIHSGKIPAELKPSNFEFLKNTQIKLLWGTKDPYLNADVIKNEKQHSTALFGSRVEYISFDGVHEVNQDLIKRIAED